MIPKRLPTHPHEDTAQSSRNEHNIVGHKAMSTLNEIQSDLALPDPTAPHQE
jgi:hypothetical protein